MIALNFILLINFNKILYFLLLKLINSCIIIIDNITKNACFCFLKTFENFSKLVKKGANFMHIGELLNILNETVYPTKTDVDFIVDFFREILTPPQTDNEKIDDEASNDYYPFYSVVNKSPISELLTKGKMSNKCKSKILSHYNQTLFSKFLKSIPDKSKLKFVNVLNDNGIKCSVIDYHKKFINVFEKMLNDKSHSIPVIEKTVPTNKKYVTVKRKELDFESISNIDEYIKNAHDKYNVIRSLLYKNKDFEFYDLYVCNNILMKRNKNKEDRSITILEDFSVENLKRINKNLIIIGAGGLGKSMMMRNIYLDALKTFNKNHYLPIIINIRDYKPNLRSINYLFDIEMKGLSLGFYNEEYNKLKEEGKILYLLDGLDEVSLEHVNDFNIELEHFIDSNIKNRFIISTREIYSYMPTHRFTGAQLAPLEPEQSIELVKKLNINELNADKENHFIELISLDFSFSHRDFIENPLLLTIMLLIYNTYGDIPSRLYQFYEKAYSVLSVEHDSSKGLIRQFKSGLNPEQLLNFLTEFSARTYFKEQPQIQFTESELKNNIDNTNFEKEHKIPFLDLKSDLTTGLCLFYEEGQIISYSHRSFQEYFTALYFYRQNDAKLVKLASKYDKSKRSFDSVLSMLYDMNNERIEKAIFYPYLKELINKWTNSENDGYYNYLEDVYGSLKFGDFDGIPVSFEIPKYPTLDFIIKKKNFSYRKKYNDLKENISMKGVHYFRIKSGETWYDENNDEVIDTDIVDEHSIPNDYDYKNFPPEDLGWSYEISIFDIYESRYEHEANYKIINKEDYPLKKQYNELLNYCKNLEKKVQDDIESESLFD